MAHCKRVRPTRAAKDSYQLRLQVYEAAKKGQQYYLTTTREIAPSLMKVLQENNAIVRSPKLK